ncbi:hypothetical protein [Streptomyces sp. CNQ085]|nr:hypothetical protein [Streptomyces sp. CNQ085]
MTGLSAALSPVAGAVLAALLILTPAYIALTAPRHRKRTRR